MNENRLAPFPPKSASRPGARLFRPARLFALAVLLLASAVSSQQAHAQAASGARTLNFGAVGVARGQAARLTVYWTRALPPGPCYPPDPCAAPETFRVRLGFYDEEGRPVARQEATLHRGRAETLVYEPLDLAPGARVSARAFVEAEADPSGFIPCIVPTVEIVNRDGAPSSFLSPGALVGFNPQPEPPGNFGFISAVRGQTFRVSASHIDDGELPPGPCRITLSFYDTDGRLVAQTVRTLEPGKTVSFDVSAGELRTDSPHLRASVHVEPLSGGLIPCVLPAVEVFNDDTGRTTLFYPGTTIGGKGR